MNPEEKELLKRTAKLSEENNVMLRSIRRAIRWGQFWGLIKILLLVIPLIIGFWYLQPYFDSAKETFNETQDLLRLVQ